jgi:capsular polysaccharide biosynthesis protein
MLAASIMAWGRSCAPFLMDLVNILRELWRQKVLVVLAAIVSIVVGLSASYDVSYFPPSLQQRSFEVGAAQTQVLVDRRQSAVVAFPRSSVGDSLTNQALTSRAATLARIVPTSDIVEDIARRMRLPVQAIAVTPPPDPVPQGQTRQTQAADRATNIVAEGGRYRLLLKDNSVAPVISIYAQAPDARGAQRLADRTVDALTAYVKKQQRRDDVADSRRVDVTQLGRVNGGTVSESPNPTIAFVAGIGTFVLLLIVILAVAPPLRTIRQERRLRSRNDATTEPQSGATG